MTASVDGPSDVPLFLHRNLMIVFSITIVGVMGTPSIAPALPSVVRALDLTVEQRITQGEWQKTSYKLSFFSDLRLKQFSKSPISHHVKV